MAHSTKSKRPSLPREKAPKKTGRPPVDVDLELLDDLASIHCTYEEMAAILKVDADTLAKRFSERIEQKKQSGKSSLRRRQWRAAEEGDRTMLIWLGKQWLGQTDKTATDITTQGEKVAVLPPIAWTDQRP